MNTFDAFKIFNIFPKVEYETFDNLNSLMDRIRSHEEVIAFTYKADWTCDRFLDYLDWSNNLGRILCVAHEFLNFRNVGEHFTHDKPVFALEMLKHFAKTALFVVFATGDNVDKARQVLEKFGCVHAAILDKSAIDAFLSERKKLLDAGAANTKFMDYVKLKIDSMETQISESQEMVDTHLKTFAEYEGAFYGKEVVVVANGPTAKYYKPIPGAIHVGVNRAWKLEEVPLDYLFAIDAIANLHMGKISDGFDKIGKGIFLGRFSANSGFQYVGFDQDIISGSNSHDKIRKYFLNHISRGDVRQRMHLNLCYHYLVDGGAVTFNALQFALFTHPKTIYLVGCDVTSDGHFYDKEGVKTSTGGALLPKVKVFYAKFKLVAKRDYPKTRIVSINPVGLKGLFEDVYTDEYLKSQSESGK